MSLAVAAICLAVTAAPSFAATYNLRAEAASAVVDGVGMVAWGFVCDSTDVVDTRVVCDGTFAVPGPRIVVPAGDTTLTINLTNNLGEPASIVIPSLPATLSPTWINPTTGTVTATGSRPAGDTTSRARSLTTETPAGGSGSYVWSNVRPGTFVYHSGTNVAKQVHMGLYGAVTQDFAAGQAYDGVPYDTEIVLIYSEVDPALRATAGFAHALDYDPRYFLINGRVFDGSMLPAVTVGQRVLLRFVNAGLRSYVPTLQSGYMDVVAEDGNLYTYVDPTTNTVHAHSREQYSVLLPADKTTDAVWTPLQAGIVNLFDRRLHLTNNGAPGGGMLARLQASAGALSASDDAYPTTGSWLEDSGVFSVAATEGLLANDGVGATQVSLVSGPSAGTLTLNLDGSFDYTPDPNFNGTDIFTYQSSDGTNVSNAATVRLTVSPVNDAPAAGSDSYAATANEPLVVGAPGILGNDSDVDGDTLQAVLDTPPAGILSLNSDGSFTFTASAAGVDSFSYHAFDGGAASATVTVTINVAPPSNQPPVANDDLAATKKNVDLLIGLVANDADVDGTIDPTTVIVTGEVSGVGGWTASTSGGGTVLNFKNGTVLYTPKNNFRGTDTFTYTVKDNLGATSNVATVRINVTK